MRTERLLIDTVILWLVGSLLGVVGWLAAPTILESAIRASGASSLAITSPTDIVAEYRAIAIALSMTAPLTWLVGLTYRIAARRPPPLLALGLVCMMLFASAALAMAGMVWWMTDALSDEQRITPMLTPASFELGPSGAGMACRVALLLGVVAFGVGRRRVA